MMKLVAMLLREALASPALERLPEPTAEMDDPAQVEAFHRQGASALLPVYHFNALATSTLVPKGGVVLDLGSGSGQYLAYLARARPDIQIVGMDLADSMLAVGRRSLSDEGLSERVRLVTGNMTSFASEFPGPIDLVSSVFSLHHLETIQDLEACLKEICALRERFGCAVWIFDHVRPHRVDTPRIFPEIFTPDAPRAFKEDSCNSLIASYSFDEMRQCLTGAGLGAANNQRARWMRLYQVHWVASKQGECLPGDWQGELLPPKAKRDYEGLRRLFPRVPQA